MHDLTTIQGDEPVGQRPYQTLPEAKRKSKQASEPAGMLICYNNIQGLFTNGLEVKVLETELTLSLISLLLRQSLV